MPAAVVDCGSGSTRIARFTLEANAGASGLAASWTTSPWRGQALATALVDDEGMNGLVDMLEKELPDGQVLLGATAGVRAALAKGHVPLSRLHAFEQLLQDRFGGRAGFELLSGEQEARSEWEAVLHELRRHPGELAAEDAAGMLSGGGMSCQLVARQRRAPGGAGAAAGGADGGAALEVVSFENRVLEPGGPVERAERGELTLQELERLLVKREAEAVEQARLPSDLRGPFVLVEWVGNFVAGKPTARDLTLNLGFGRLLSRAELLEALDNHLEQLRQGQAGEGAAVPRPVALALTYGTLIRAVIQEAFHEEATFFGLRGVNWTLGHFLLHTSDAALESAKRAKRAEGTEGAQGAEGAEGAEGAGPSVGEAGGAVAGQ